MTDPANSSTSSRTPPPVARALARLVDVRADEVRVMFLASAYFFFLLSSYFILRPIRDAMGVAAGVAKLPWLFVGTLSATLVCQPLFAALVARFPARRFIAFTYQFFAFNLLAFWLLLHGGADAGSGIGRDVWVGRAFFVWTSVFNLFVVSVFWCFMADIFASEQAKRLFGFIGVGGTLGSLAGSAVTASLAERIGTINLLIVSIVLLEIATLIVALFPKSNDARRSGVTETPAAPIRAASPGAGARPPRREAPSDALIGGSAWSGIANVARSPYLMGISAFLVLYTIGSTFLYFQQADIIGAVYATREARTQILAKMEFASQLITVLTQLFFTGRIIRTVGLPTALALMPAISILGFVAIGVSAYGLLPTLGTFVVFNVLRRGTNFALTNPSMEVLFTVVPREDKYKAKSFIETFVYRAGDQLAAWTYAGLAAIGLSRTGTAWPAALLAAAFLVVGVWLGRRQQALQRSVPAQSPAAAA